MNEVRAAVLARNLRPLDSANDVGNVALEILTGSLIVKPDCSPRFEPFPTQTAKIEIRALSTTDNPARGDPRGTGANGSIGVAAFRMLSGQ